MLCFADCGLPDIKMSNIPPQHQRLAVVEERLKDPSSELNIDSLLVSFLVCHSMELTFRYLQLSVVNDDNIYPK